MFFAPATRSLPPDFGRLKSQRPAPPSAHHRTGLCAGRLFERSEMRHREVFGRGKWGARAISAALVLFALLASLIPATPARQTTGRPRRVNPSKPTQKGAYATPQATPTPAAKPTPTRTPATPKQTPAPAANATPQQ